MECTDYPNPNPNPSFHREPDGLRSLELCTGRSNTYGERRRSESNRRMEVLQTSALPLGYGAGGQIS